MISKAALFKFAILLLALSYPIYETLDVLFSGSIDGHCVLNTYRASGSGIGIYCDWGLSLGNRLFGADHAHLGYSLLLGTTILAFIGLVIYVMRKD